MNKINQRQIYTIKNVNEKFLSWKEIKNINRHLELHKGKKGTVSGKYVIKYKFHFKYFFKKEIDSLEEKW